MYVEFSNQFYSLERNQIQLEPHKVFDKIQNHVKSVIFSLLKLCSYKKYSDLVK